MGKATKATRKFAASGQLKKTIQARHKSRAIRKKIQARKGPKTGKPQPKTHDVEEESDVEGENEAPRALSGKKGCVCISLSSASRT